ncbi:MAG: hypothetical protein LC623_02785 [Halobacteriales archaeon]|nr:hypothetical protein [Halobacteriales archaeon]
MGSTMGWKVAIAIVFTAALGLPTPAAAEEGCRSGPTGFDAVREGDQIHLMWNPQVDCPEEGVFELYRNGTLVTETNQTSYSEPLTLPVAYSLAWVVEANNSAPSTLVLVGNDLRFDPHIDMQGLDSFAEYIVRLAPCPPIHIASSSNIPWLFEITWECLPINGLRVAFV